MWPVHGSVTACKTQQRMTKALPSFKRMLSWRIPSYWVNSVRRSDMFISVSSRDVPHIPWLHAILYEVVTWPSASTKERSGLRGRKASDGPKMEKGPSGMVPSRNNGGRSLHGYPYNSCLEAKSSLPRCSLTFARVVCLTQRQTLLKNSWGSISGLSRGRLSHTTTEFSRKEGRAPWECTTPI